MLTLTYKVPPTSLADDDSPREKFWRVGDEPLFDQLDDAGLEVLSIVAEDDELTYIRNFFHNLPVTRNGRCVWRGEVARFIFDNMT